MRNRGAFCALLICWAIFHLQASEKIATVSTTTATMVGTALFRADIALAKSIVSPTDFRGSLGENVAGQCFLKNTLSRTGNWQAITPRSGRQGLDHLYVKTNSNGVPTKLLIGESKFNTSTLGETHDGIQMGKTWINRRLFALGSRYLNVAGDANITIARMPLNPNRSIEVTLPNGAHRHFWKNSSTDTWKFSGTKEELDIAKSQASRYGMLFQKAGNDIISYRSRIFNILPKGNDLEIIVYDAANVEKNAVIHDLKKLSTFSLKNALTDNKKISSGLVDDMAKVLQHKLRLTDSEARSMARNVLRQYTAKDLMKPSSIHREIFTSKALWGGVSIVAAISLVDVSTRFVASGFDVRSLDWRPTVFSTASAFGGIVSGHYIKAGLSLPYAHNIVRSLSAPLHCSAGTLTTFLSSNTATVLALAVYNYGMYFFGGQDLRSANRQMLVGSIAAGAGSLFVAGTMSALAAWGTASTGTAIATLSGAAATNASLALLGGGTLAAGGGGVALGTAVLSGGTLLVVVGVTYVGYKLYELKDAHDETLRIAYMLNFYSNESNLHKAISRKYSPKSNRPYKKPAEQAPIQTGQTSVEDEPDPIDAPEHDHAIQRYRSSGQGNAWAEYNLGNAYYFGNKNTKRNYKEAVKWFQKAASMGDSWAKYNLGVCYRNGQGVKQDIKEAIKLYQAAAQQGVVEAKQALERLELNRPAENGHTEVQQKPNEQDRSGADVEGYDHVIQRYRTAGEGKGWAEYNLGIAYYLGSEKVKQDYEKAVEWFQKAAIKGDPWAKYNLGVCYRNGQGVKQDIKEAEKLYKEAAQQGVVEAKQALEKLQRVVKAKPALLPHVPAI